MQAIRGQYRTAESEKFLCIEWRIFLISLTGFPQNDPQVLSGARGFAAAHRRSCADFSAGIRGTAAKPIR
jgi:hypothetical protein